MKRMGNPETEMFAFFEKTPVLVCIASRDGYFLKVNEAVQDKLGYTETELYASPISTFIYEEDKSLTEWERKKLLNGKPLLNFRNRYVSRNGNLVWLEWTSIYFPEKEVVFALAMDISERKELENQVEEKYKQFKSLATHFKSRIEKDRKFLALELHEELAQLAAAVKLDLDGIIDELPGMPEKLKVRMTHASAVTDLLLRTIRRISFSISPQMLDDYGLDETLRWHCNEFSLINGIPCRFKSNYNEADLSKEVQLDFFRICQEALSNVMYHAQAKKVEIDIRESDEKIQLCITDDGIGFEPMKLNKSSGLINMKERAASINGHLQVESKPRNGTRICVSIPKR
jgi:PAS domain S-box-containing protein